MIELPEHMRAVPDTQFLTPDQVSERLGISRSKLAHLRATGDGPRYIKVGRRVRYSTADVIRWADEQLISSPSRLM